MALALVLSTGAYGDIAARAAEQADDMRISITIGNDVLTASLNNSEAARAFAEQLPLTLTLDDYNATEKVSDLPARLPRTGAPAGYAPGIGDITYYAPWGNLAIFYRAFAYSPGLIALGRINTGMEIIARGGRFQVTIARTADSNRMGPD